MGWRRVIRPGLVGEHDLESTRSQRFGEYHGTPSREQPLCACQTTVSDEEEQIEFGTLREQDRERSQVGEFKAVGREDETAHLRFEQFMQPTRWGPLALLKDAERASVRHLGRKPTLLSRRMPE